MELDSIRHELAELFSNPDYLRKARSFATKIAGNPDDADDIVGETIVRASENLSKFEGRSELSTWVNAILRNETMALLRRSKKYRERFELFDEDQSTCCDEVADNYGHPATKWTCEDRLIAEERDRIAKEVLWHIYHNMEKFALAYGRGPEYLRSGFEILLMQAGGKTYKEIASEMEMNQNTAKVMAHHARRFLTGHFARNNIKHFDGLLEARLPLYAEPCNSQYSNSDSNISNVKGRPNP